MQITQFSSRYGCILEPQDCYKEILLHFCNWMVATWTTTIAKQLFTKPFCKYSTRTNNASTLSAQVDYHWMTLQMGCFCQQIVLCIVHFLFRFILMWLIWPQNVNTHQWRVMNDTVGHACTNGHTYTSTHKHTYT